VGGGEHACGGTGNMHAVKWTTCMWGWGTCMWGGVGNMHVGTGNMHEQEPRQAVCSYNLCFIHLLYYVMLCFKIFGHAECEPPYTLGDRAKNWNT
jgi:hypothetical protein